MNFKVTSKARAMRKAGRMLEKSELSKIIEKVILI
jgi:hypothetical protein